MTTLAAIWTRPIRLGDNIGAAATSWIMLMPLGDFEHPDYGELHFTRSKLKEFQSNFENRTRKIDIALDVDHLASSPKTDSRATGWIECLQYREAMGDIPAGLWGQIDWTPYGAAFISNREYRYFSPEFGTYTDEENGKSFDNVIIGGALTNRPFLKVMPAITLHAPANTSIKTMLGDWHKNKKGAVTMAVKTTPIKKKQTPAMASNVDDYDATNSDDATQFDDGNADDDATLDDGGEDDSTLDDGADEGDTYDDSSDGADDSNGDGGADSTIMSRKAGGRKMSSKKASGRKMSESVQMSEVRQLREQIAQTNYRLYERDVEDMVRAWKSGRSIQLNDATETSALPQITEFVGGRRVKRFAKIEMTPKAANAIKAYLLNDGFTLDERSRTKLIGLIQTLLSETSTVNTSRLSNSYDQEQRRTVRGGNRNEPTVGGDVQEIAENLARQDNKILSELPMDQQLRFYTLAERSV